MKSWWDIDDFGFSYTWHMIIVFPNPMSAVFYIVYMYSKFGHKMQMKNELR